MVLDEAHKRQVEETMETLAEGAGGLLLSFRRILSLSTVERT
jgi:hypothetical protein